MSKGKKKEREELDFYRSLSISRVDGVTTIDGGETARKLHTLWEERERYAEYLRNIRALDLAPTKMTIHDACRLAHEALEAFIPDGETDD